MKKLLLIFALLIFAFIGTANAIPITIENAGFENDTLNNGDWIYSADSWIENGAGTWNPTDGDPDFFNPAAPEGENVAFINGGWLYQDLGAAYQANINYTLTFQTGWRNDQVLSAFNVELRTIGNVSLATLSSSDLSLTQGEWTFSELTLASTSIPDNFIGENIRIVFHKIGGGQFNFDDIKFNAAPVPEPATMMLFGIGLLGLAGVSRRKK